MEVQLDNSHSFRLFRATNLQYDMTGGSIPASASVPVLWVVLCLVSVGIPRVDGFISDSNVAGQQKAPKYCYCHNYDFNFFQSYYCSFEDFGSVYDLNDLNIKEHNNAK